MRVDHIVVLDARLLVQIVVVLVELAMLLAELSRVAANAADELLQAALVGAQRHYELAGLEDVEDARDQLVVVARGRIGLEAHVGAARLGRYVYGEVVALGQQGVHRVAARIEEEAVEDRVGEDGVDARLARGLLGAGAHLLGEDAHHVRVEFGHDDLERLVGLLHRHRLVQRVQVPAVAVELAERVRVARDAEQLVEHAHLVLERVVGRLLQVGSHEAATRVEHVADRVEAGEHERRVHERLDRLEQRGRAARLDEQARLVDEQRALAQHVRVEIACARAAEYLAVDHVEYVVDALARYVAQVVLQRVFAVRARKPDLQQFLSTLEEGHFFVVLHLYVCVCVFCSTA